MNERTQCLLKALVEHYIADGQPVGSRTLQQVSGLDLSAASIRHVLADLEDLGLIVSPHPSAGRIPTARGYRVFVDQLLTVSPLEHDALLHLAHELHPDSPQRLAVAASQLLSELTQFAGVVMVPQRADISFRQIEFLHLSERCVLLIIVSMDGDVQNHLLRTPRDYSARELSDTAQLLNRQYAGQALTQIARNLEHELHSLQSDIAFLMSAAVSMGAAALNDPADAVVIAGARHLLGSEDLAADLASLRKLFDLFEQKTELLQLLNLSREAQGMRLFIGEESGVQPLDGCSVVTAPYSRNGQVLGTLGVVGPTRMAYKRVIPIVEITARLVTSALAQAV